MKTDAWSYGVFESQPETFFELLGQPPQTASGYQFQAMEWKEVNRRADGVFVPQDEAERVYFVEVYFYKNPKAYANLLTKVHLYREQHLDQPWCGVLLFASRADEPTPTPFDLLVLHEGYLQRFYLNELPPGLKPSIGWDLLRLICAPKTQVPPQARAVVQRIAHEVTDPAKQRRLQELVDHVVCSQFPELSEEELKAMLDLGSLEHTKAFQQGVQKGKQEGLQQAKREGKLEGKIESIANLAKLGLSAEQIAQGLGLDIEVVRQTLQQPTPPT